MGSEPDGCCFDDWASFYAKRARERKVVGISARLLKELEAAGVRGRTVLELGCGAGGLAMEALERGAAQVTGMDLSRKAIDSARAIAHERGLDARANFSVGDGAAEALDRHDVVVLDKVFCCYPGVEALLGNSLSAARTIYAYSIPESAGLAGRINRVFLGAANSWYRLRDSKFRGFRTFVHDETALEARIREIGFLPVAVGTRRLWRYAVFAKS